MNKRDTLIFRIVKTCGVKIRSMVDSIYGCFLLVLLCVILGVVELVAPKYYEKHVKLYLDKMM